MPPLRRRGYLTAGNTAGGAADGLAPDFHNGPPWPCPRPARAPPQPDRSGAGRLQHVQGPYAAPVLRIAPSDTVEVQTLEAFGGVIRTEADPPSAILNMPLVNPQNGPIAVTGAEKGDTLAVHIRSILPCGPQPAGTTCIIPQFVGLVATPRTAMLNAPIPERVKKMVVIPDGVAFSDPITLPYEPFIVIDGALTQDVQF